MKLGCYSYILKYISIFNVKLVCIVGLLAKVIVLRGSVYETITPIVL